MTRYRPDEKLCGSASAESRFGPEKSIPTMKARQSTGSQRGTGRITSAFARQAHEVGQPRESLPMARNLCDSPQTS